MKAGHDLVELAAGFGHREHLHLAWRYLHLTDPETAEHWMCRAIRHLATGHHTPDKYHVTLTIACASAAIAWAQ